MNTEVSSKEDGMNSQKIAWYILDEIAVKHSATHCGSGNQPCGICDRAVEAMHLLDKPTHEECQQLYDQRRRADER